MSLYDFINSDKNDILSLAREKIMARKWPTVSAMELEHGLPLFLTQLSETLRLRSSSEPFSSTAIGNSAGKHGGEAVAKNVSVAQLVHDYVERSLAAMRDLLDTTISEVRLAAGNQESKRISVARFMHEMEGAASLQAAQREMNVTFRDVPADLMINADAQLLSSALFNLIQNAFKYSVPHGEALFTPFGARRGQDRTRLGLGLNISRKAVKAFGGDITVRDLPGKGCIFAIEMPAST